MNTYQGRRDITIKQKYCGECNFYQPSSTSSRIGHCKERTITAFLDISCNKFKPYKNFKRRKTSNGNKKD
jgi:hypothetical protein